jgi:hypothetical protein
MNHDKAETAEPSARSAAAERTRLYRQRKQRGLLWVTIELFPREIEELIRRGLLASEMRNDRHAIKKALHSHFDRTLKAPE